MPKRINRLKLPPIKPEGKNVICKISGEFYVKSLGESKDFVRLTPEVDYMIEQNKKEGLKRLLKKKRELTESSLKELVHQWRTLEQKELSFQRTIITHNRFLRRNLEKRERAFLKIQSDMDLIKKRTRDIKLLSQKYINLKGALIMMRNEIEKHSIYENYILLVMKDIDCPFKMVFEFLTKFEALLEVKEYCINRQSKEMSTTIKMQDTNKQHFRHQKIAFIGLRNEVNKLSVKYDETIRRNLASEALLRRVIIKTNDLSDEIRSCQFTIDTIYRYICRRRGISVGSFDLRDIQPKVDEIKHTLAGYAKLLPTLRRKNRSKEYRKPQTLRRLSVPKDEIVWNDKGSSQRHSNATNNSSYEYGSSEVKSQ